MNKTDSTQNTTTASKTAEKTSASKTSDTKSSKFGITAIVLALIIGFAGGFQAREILRAGHQEPASQQGTDDKHDKSQPDG